MAERLNAVNVITGDPSWTSLSGVPGPPPVLRLNGESSPYRFVARLVDILSGNLDLAPAGSHACMHDHLEKNVATYICGSGQTVQNQGAHL